MKRPPVVETNNTTDSRTHPGPEGLATSDDPEPHNNFTLIPERGRESPNPLQRSRIGPLPVCGWFVNVSVRTRGDMASGHCELPVHVSCFELRFLGVVAECFGDVRRVKFNHNI